MNQEKVHYIARTHVYIYIYIIEGVVFDTLPLVLGGVEWVGGVEVGVLTCLQRCKDAVIRNLLCFPLCITTYYNVLLSITLTSMQRPNLL